MLRTIPLVLALATALPAFAQTPSEVLNPDTCGSYLAMETAQRIGLLTTIEPVGDEVNEADQNQARQWSEDVAAACEGHPERSLSEAADEALLSE